MSLIKSVASGALFSLIGFAASAADYSDAMFAPPPLDPPKAVELGSGWYLRGDAGWGRASLPILNADASFSAAPRKSESWVLGLGAGYRFNNWFRTDLTLDWRSPQSSRAVGANVWCPYALAPLVSSTGTQFGYAYNPNDTCTPTQSSSVRRLHPMLNGYIDLGTWNSVTPYVGAGVGFAWSAARQQLNYTKTADGSLYNVDLTPTGSYPLIWASRFDGSAISPQPNVAFTKQYWDRYYKASTWRFSWALMAGVAVDIAPHTKLDLGYRSMDVGSYTSVSPATGQATTQKMVASEMRIGIRYSPD